MGVGVREDVGVGRFEGSGATHPASSKAVTVTVRTAFSMVLARLFSIGLTNPLVNWVTVWRVSGIYQIDNAGW